MYLNLLSPGEVNKETEAISHSTHIGDESRWMR